MDPHLPHPARRGAPPVLALGLLLAAALGAAGCIGQDALAGDVAVASYPAAFLVQSLAGDDLRVIDVGTAGEAHHFEPSARDLSTLRKTPHLVLWHHELESWAERATDNLGARGPSTFEALRLPPGEEPIEAEEHEGEAGEEEGPEAGPGEGVQEHGHLIDPHTWLDPLAMVESARAVAAYLSQAYPEHAANITARLAILEARLEGLHTAFSEALDPCRHDLIVTNHDAYSYLARRYGFDVLSLHGISPGSEPSPAVVQEAIQEIRTRGLPVLFIEEGTDRRVVLALLQETDAQVRVLATLETRPDSGDYVDAQLANAAALKAALACT